MTGCSTFQPYGFPIEAVSTPVNGHTFCDGVWIQQTTSCSKILLPNGYSFGVDVWYPGKTAADVPKSFVNSVTGWVMWYDYYLGGNGWEISASELCAYGACTGSVCSTSDSFNGLSPNNLPASVPGHWILNGNYDANNVVTFLAGSMAPPAGRK
jgi:hypothetical protein